MQFVDQPTVETNVERDIPNQRLIHTRYGFDVKLERRDPYGFVYVVWNKGPTPEPLAGAYSDFNTARLAVTNYLSNNTFNTVVEEPVIFEKAQYKKRVKQLNG